MEGVVGGTTPDRLSTEKWGGYVQSIPHQPLLGNVNTNFVRKGGTGKRGNQQRIRFGGMGGGRARSHEGPKEEKNKKN